MKNYWYWTCFCVLFVSSAAHSSFLSSGSVRGDVFLVRGSGDVVPAAGRTVYLLPFESELEIFYPAFNEAYEKISEKNKAEILGTCAAAAERIAIDSSKQQSLLDEAVSRETVPEGGCVVYEDEVNRLSDTVDELTAHYKKKGKELSKEINELERVKLKKIEKGLDDFVAKRVEMDSALVNLKRLKNDKLKVMVDAAERDVRDKISVVILRKIKSRYSTRIPLEIVLRNDSDYCVHEVSFELSAGGVVSEEYGRNFKDRVDEYGFKYNCPIPPKGSKAIHVQYDPGFIVGNFRVNTPRKRMLVSEMSLETYEHSGGDFLFPTESKVIDFEITTPPQKVRSGDQVSYMVEDVDFEQIVKANNKFSEDKEIIKIQDNFSLEKMKYDDLIVSAKKDEALKIKDVKKRMNQNRSKYRQSYDSQMESRRGFEGKLSKCKKDNILIDGIESKLSDLRGMSSTMKRCANGGVDGEVYGAIEALKLDYPYQIGEIPDMRSGLSEEFVNHVLLSMALAE